MNVECTSVSSGTIRDSRQVAGFELSCTRCGMCMVSRGVTDSSIRRVFAVFRQTCPRGETNFYATISGIERPLRDTPVPYGGMS